MAKAWLVNISQPRLAMLQEKKQLTCDHPELEVEPRDMDMTKLPTVSHRFCALALGAALLHLAGCGSSAESVDPPPVVLEDCAPLPEEQLEDCYAGDFVHILSAEDLEPFCGNPCTRVKALNVGPVEGLRDLQPLSNLRHIEQGLYVGQNPHLRSLHGLEKAALEPGAKLAISENQQLESLQGLGPMTRLGGESVIRDNPKLRSLDGMEGVVETASLMLHGNEALENVEALQNLREVDGNFTVWENRSLENLRGLENLERIRYSFNVDGNAALRDMRAVMGLRHVGLYYVVENNPALPQCQAQTVLEGLDERPSMEVRVSGNSTSQEGCDDL